MPTHAKQEPAPVRAEPPGPLEELALRRRIEPEVVAAAVRRQEGTLRALINRSPMANDAGTVEDILDTYRERSPGEVQRHAGRIAAALTDLRVAEELLGRRRGQRQWRAIGIAVSATLYLAGYLVVDVATGSGPAPTEAPPGWLGVLFWADIICFLVAGYLGIWAGRDAFRKVADADNAEEKRLTEEIKALTAEMDQVVESEWVRPLVAQTVYARRSPTFSSTLKLEDPVRLSGTSFEVLETQAHRQVDELVSGAAGTSIGLCGPRGVGKTTLISKVCHSSSGQADPPVIGVCVSAPVLYTPRDFLATTYARLVREVKQKIPDVAPRSTAPEVPLVRHKSLWLVILVVGIGALAILIQQQDLVGPLVDLYRPENMRREPLVPALSAVFLFLLIASALAFRSRRRSRVRRTEQSWPEAMREKLVSAARILKADVATTAASRTSAGLLGASMEQAGSVQESRGIVSYPDLVDDFKDFIRLLVAGSFRVHIGVDELDKLAPDDARTFLNSIKAVFFVDGAHFLISVSEDAMSDFERRGLPVRDAFDSSLDEVVQVDELNVEQSMRLLYMRGEQSFPLSFGALCHCLAGGLPRELLRVARRLVRHNAQMHGEDHGRMAPLCARLLDDDLTAKSAALWVVARRLSVDPYAMRFRTWLSVSDDRRSRPDQLLRTCREYLDFPSVDPKEFSTNQEWSGQVEQLGALALEHAGYQYFAATLLEFFSSSADVAFQEALAPGAGAGSLETLSSARARFADDPRLAWDLVSKFRDDHGMVPVLPVPLEGWKLPTPSLRLATTSG
jgi:hypothetical protein